MDMNKLTLKSQEALAVAQALAKENLVIRRCEACGDTFPIHVVRAGEDEEEEKIGCPSCGALETVPADEPLL